MALVFIAFCPSSPLLVPSIGKEHSKRLSPTISSLEGLAQELYSAKPDVLLTISTQTKSLGGSYIIDIAENYQPDLSEFGDFSNKSKFKPSLSLISMIGEEAEDHHIPIQSNSQSKLDYNTAIPLWFLTKLLPKLMLIPLHTTDLNMKINYNFGRLLYNIGHQTDKRVAVIATGSLSQTLAESSPAGYNESGVTLVKKIRAMIRQNKLANLLKIDPQLPKTAISNGFDPLIVLAGLLSNYHYQSVSPVFQEIFGTGLLTANFTFDR
ncbi:MAG: hypothetical protein V1838_02800 [Patescibacteria group bacterium]